MTRGDKIIIFLIIIKIEHSFFHSTQAEEEVIYSKMVNKTESSKQVYNKNKNIRLMALSLPPFRL